MTVLTGEGMRRLVLAPGDGQDTYITIASLLEAPRKHSRAPKVDTLPCIDGTDSFPPTQGRELVSHKHGASVTADCDRNGWKLLLPPFLSHTAYYCWPPSHFHPLSGFLFTSGRCKHPHRCLRFCLTSFYCTFLTFHSLPALLSCVYASVNVF